MHHDTVDIFLLKFLFVFLDVSTVQSSVGKGTVIFLCLPSYYPLTVVGTVIFSCLPARFFKTILAKCPGSGSPMNVVRRGK